MPDFLETHLRRWSEQLQKSSDSARLDAEILLRHASGMSDTQLITRSRERLDTELVTQVDELIRERMKGAPIAYLTGHREFYALLLRVNSQVLIPRPETELLVESALEKVTGMETPRILELGTGSGAISLAIAHNAPHAQLVATDISDPALKIASHNAHRYHIGNIRFERSNWFEGLSGEQFDLILSNPPYIDPEDIHLQQGDLRFEPRIALVAEQHGLADIRTIIDQAPHHLEGGGYLMLEHGYDQGPAVCKMLDSRGFKNTRTLQDLNRLDRLSLARKDT